MSNAQTIAAQVTSDTTALTDHDRAIIERVESALADGAEMKRWWEQTFPDDFTVKFELERVFNRPAKSFGFFDELSLARGVLPVMGNFQEMFYDRPRTPTNLNRQAAEWMRDQIREFVLHYFMRISAFRQPEVYVESGRVVLPGYLKPLSWCPQEDVLRQGFGFTQWYYKLRESGMIGKFSETERTAILDLREIGSRYEWIIVKVRIFDFSFMFQPFGSRGPSLSLPLTEESYLVVSRDFILNEDNPSPDCLGHYGLGYAFIRDPTEGLIGYGPGQFRAAVEIINFEVSKLGEVCVKMIFVADRPERIANVSLNPVDWSFQLADILSFGMTSKLLGPVKNTLERIPTATDSFDPVYGFVSLANTLTANQAAEQLCISKERLDKDFLAQHFMQHYATIVGSLLTWRQIPDWLDSAALPEWVVTGEVYGQKVTAPQGVVLSLGGADGAYGVGVLKALVNGKSPVTDFKPLDPEVLVGNSIGGLNAALLVSQLEKGPQAAVSYLENVWLEEMAQGAEGCGNGTYRVRLNPSTLLDPTCYFATPVRTLTNIAVDSAFLAQDSIERTLDFVSSSGRLGQRGLRLVNLASFISAEPLQRLIERTIRFDNIRRSSTALRIMATNWTKGGLEGFSNTELTDELGPSIVKASAAIPGFFPPVKIGEDIYVDAAVLGYATLAPAINAGADTLHVIYVDPEVAAIPIETMQSTLDTLYRIFVIQWADNLDVSVQAVDRINDHVAILEQTIRETKMSDSQARALITMTLPPGRFTIGPSDEIVGLRKVTVHRYHPTDDLFGPLGLLNLDLRRIEGLIRRGFDDAVAHDCTGSNCVTPRLTNQVPAGG